MVESGEKWCVVERMWQSGCGAIHEVVRGETAISGDKRVFIMFMGEYSHTIDAKGRLIIPSKFREQLGEEFVLTKGLDGCLSIYPNDEWAAFEEKLRALPLTNKNARTFSGEDSRTGNAAGICWSGKRCSPYRKYQPD